ncbi:MAG: CrcB family protein, partial [Anaerolineales bacterium]
MDKYLLVGLGGFLGAIARFALGGWAAEKWGAGYPYGTLLINVSGSFVLWLFLTAG